MKHKSRISKQIASSKLSTGTVSSRTLRSRSEKSEKKAKVNTCYEYFKVTLFISLYICLPSEQHYYSLLNNMNANNIEIKSRCSYKDKNLWSSNCLLTLPPFHWDIGICPQTTNPRSPSPICCCYLQLFLCTCIICLQFSQFHKVKGGESVIQSLVFSAPHHSVSTRRAFPQFGVNWAVRLIN